MNDILKIEIPVDVVHEYAFDKGANFMRDRCIAAILRKLGECDLAEEIRKLPPFTK